jgi:serpin B
LLEASGMKMTLLRCLVVVGHCAAYGCIPVDGDPGPGADAAVDRHSLRDGGSPPPGEVAISTTQRLKAGAPDADLERLRRDNTETALDIFRGAEPLQHSFVYSPHSLLTALAMTYEGAMGNTSAQMSQALHFELPKPALHAAFNALDLTLAARSTEKVKLRFANALFGDKTLSFQQPFVDTLAANYGAPLSRLDFLNAPSDSRVAINEWVAQETDGAIAELIPEGLIMSNTRLVLLNAIRFLGAWQKAFDVGATHPGPFTQLDGSQVQVPLMSGTVAAPHGTGPGWEAVELPYDGGALSMLVVVPQTASFVSFVAGLNADSLGAIVAALGPGEVQVKLPRFELRTAFRAEEVLQQMGMVDAFQVGRANLSGMAVDDGFLYIKAVVHQTVVKVEEAGTEAAAGSGVVVARDSSVGPPVPLVAADRPFIFVIRDRATGAILFLGRYMGPPLTP